VIFAPKYVFRVVFEGGFLGGAHNFWGNPYLNCTTVLFDYRRFVEYFRLLKVLQFVICITHTSGNRINLITKFLNYYLIPMVRNVPDVQMFTATELVYFNFHLTVKLRCCGVFWTSM